MAHTLPLLHFNDVYRVTPQRFLPKPASGPLTFDVTQFATVVEDVRSKWPRNEQDVPDGLFLFSGDVFSPSVESSVSRGSHMVPVLNALGIDATVTGNHDFDFGYPHLTTLLKDVNFPWVLSNIVDTTTNRVPESLQEFVVLERRGLRIGIIGLVEREWITTVSSWPSNFVYKSMKDAGIELSKRLRDPSGEHKCDLIIALTHCRIPNDVVLARELFTLSPSAQSSTPIDNEHGVDLLLGGHDHLYYAGPGVTSWEGYDVSEAVLGAEHDQGQVLVVKSGSDFRDLSSIDLVLKRTADDAVRKVVISEIHGKRNVVYPTTPSSPGMKQVVDKLLSSIGSSLKAPVCRTTNIIDVRSVNIRVAESPVSNWLADIVRHAYDDSLLMKGGRVADGVLLCAGTFRGDSTYGPGVVTLGDILEILPFEDPVVVLEVDGKTLWAAVESGLSTWPAQEGRFPSISGFRVSWDSRKTPGNRVLGIWHLKPTGGGEQPSLQVEEEPVPNESGGRTYILVTREYMANGHDGYDALTSGKWVIDHESGYLMSAIVRKYLLGTHFVNKILRSKNSATILQVSDRTREAIDTQEKEDKTANAPKRTASDHWISAVRGVLRRVHSSLHYQNHLAVSATEHMSGIDLFDGSSVRKGLDCATIDDGDDQDLLVVSPEVDGRLKEEGAGAGV